MTRIDRLYLNSDYTGFQFIQGLDVQLECPLCTRPTHLVEFLSTPEKAIEECQMPIIQ
jgi:hypothetical protein